MNVKDLKHYFKFKRAPKEVGRSKLVPHQGKKECARRVRQMQKQLGEK
jgi:hypothetical protein